MTPFAEAAAGWLLTYALHSTVLLGLAWLVLRLRQAEPATAEILWKVALLGGIVTASLQSTLDLRPAGSIALTRPAIASASPIFPVLGAPSPADPVAAARTGSATEPPSGSSIGAESPVTSTTSTWWPAPPLVGSLALGWLALAIVFVTWYAGRRLILVGRLGDRRVVTDDRLRATLDALCREASVRRRVVLTASTAISSPVALGRGEICLPAAAEHDLEPDQQHAMLAHELAHLVRRDPLWLSLACVIERLFFFQPLNRIARRGIQESAEYLADEWAAHRSGGVPLARCLVKVAEWIQASPLGVPVAGMAEQRSQLSARVTRLLSRRPGNSPFRQRAVGMLSVGALFVMAGFAPGVAGHAAAPDTPLLLPVEALDALVGGFQSSQDTLPDKANRDRIRKQEINKELGREIRSRISTSININTNTNSNTNSNTSNNANDNDRGPRGVTSAADTAVVRALMARLKDEDAEVRRAAAEALGQIGEPMAIAALVQALDDQDGGVQEAALEALGNFERGVPAAPIRRMLGAENGDVRQQAVQMLGEMRDRESASAIARLVGDRDADVRQSAIQALSELGDPGSAAAVAAGLQDGDPEVRQAAIEAMRQLGGTINDASLTRLAQDQDADVRQATIWYVAERQVTSAVPHLIRLLDDPAAEVRRDAAEALTEVRTPEGHAALRKALNHPDAKVRRVAVEYFGNEGDQR